MNLRPMGLRHNFRHICIVAVPPFPYTTGGYREQYNNTVGAIVWQDPEIPETSIGTAHKDAVPGQRRTDEDGRTSDREDRCRGVQHQA